MWDALLTLERDVKSLQERENGGMSPVKGNSVFEMTKSEEIPTFKSLDIDPSVSQSMLNSVESLEETREPNGVPEEPMVEESPVNSSISQIKTKEVYYFPKNALVSTPLYSTTLSTEALRTSVNSNTFDNSIIGASVSNSGNNSPRRRPKPRIQRNYPSLDIIRSPLKRQQYLNKNKFDTSTYSWKPTVLTNKYNERFQYPADLAEAAKMNAIYTRPEEY